MGNSCGWGDSQRPKKTLKKSMEFNWIIQRGGGFFILSKYGYFMELHIDEKCNMHIRSDRRSAYCVTPSCLYYFCSRNQNYKLPTLAVTAMLSVQLFFDVISALCICRYLLVMPAYSAKDNSLAVKLLTRFSENVKQGLPPVISNIMVLDSRTGLPQAVG